MYGSMNFPYLYTCGTTTKMELWDISSSPEGSLTLLAVLYAELITHLTFITIDRNLTFFRQPFR